MDETPSDRRRFLALVSGSLTVGVAGCSALTGSKDTPDEAPPGGTETTETGPSTPALSVSISTANQPSQLPPIWRDHSIEDFQAQFTVETSGSPESVTVSNGKVELTQDSAQWADGMLTVQPGQMKRGEQEFTATASHGDQHAQDTATAAKPTPGTHKLDIVPNGMTTYGRESRRTRMKPTTSSSEGGSLQTILYLIRTAAMRNLDLTK